MVSISDKHDLHFKELFFFSAFHMLAAIKMHYLELQGKKIKMIVFLASDIYVQGENTRFCKLN